MPPNELLELLPKLRVEPLPLPKLRVPPKEPVGAEAALPENEPVVLLERRPKLKEPPELLLDVPKEPGGVEKPRARNEPVEVAALPERKEPVVRLVRVLAHEPVPRGVP